jgi:integrase
VDMPDGIGTHTMRKTFGYWYYKQTKDVAKLQIILNHSHPRITLKYIGITDEEIEDSLNDFVL